MMKEIDLCIKDTKELLQWDSFSRFHKRLLKNQLVILETLKEMKEALDGIRSSGK